MNDVDYRSESDKFFIEVEDELDSYDWDFDYDNKGDIFIIYNNGQEYMVMTKNYGQHEIWLVAGKDAYQFIYENKNWVSKKNKTESMLEVIKRYLDMVSGEKGQIF
ncbi:MAG: iron donor protein CyaY [Neisseriaceae bacterium]|nr:iron donor protein CyaY [Neisseriaceae bacterium PsAf]MCV2502877.1 iron donor protein CyaY [Neisseriaceae bacterium]MCV2509009.1 iron donor protein CyaY [Neisseriaceae bacterium]